MLVAYTPPAVNLKTPNPSSNTSIRSHSSNLTHKLSSASRLIRCNHVRRCQSARSGQGSRDRGLQQGQTAGYRSCALGRLSVPLQGRSLASSSSRATLTRLPGYCLFFHPSIAMEAPRREACAHLVSWRGCDGVDVCCHVCATSRSSLHLQWPACHLYNDPACAE